MTWEKRFEYAQKYLYEEIGIEGMFLFSGLYFALGAAIWFILADIIISPLATYFGWFLILSTATAWTLFLMFPFICILLTVALDR